MTTPPPFAATLSRSDLTIVLRALNSAQDPELRDELRRLVMIWKSSSAAGPNLEQMLCDQPLLGAYLRRGFQIQYLPTTSGGAQLGLVEGPVLELNETLRQMRRVSVEDGDAKLRILRESVILFARLTLNPRWMDLAGPCRRCDRFFLRKRKSHDTYCKAACGHATTAAHRVREKRVLDRQERLMRAREAAERWSKAPTAQEWKRWVAAKAGLRVQFLTRAVNRGELAAPVKMTL